MDLLQCLNGVVQVGHHLTSGAGRTAPESRVEASASWFPGCSDPAAGQNRNRCSWCSPSDLNKRCMSKDIAEIISDG